MTTRAADELGTGMIGTIGGALMFLTFLFVAVQVVLYLVATSVATTAALETARYASSEGGLDAGRRQAAIEVGQGILGSAAPPGAITVSEPSPGMVEARVRMSAPRVYGPLVAAVPGLAEIERAVQYRREGQV